MVAPLPTWQYSPGPRTAQFGSGITALCQLFSYYSRNP